MNQAARWGGHELGSEAVVELVGKVAEGDGSSGWVFGLLASHFWLGSVFSPEAQEDMWADDPDALMSSSFAAAESRCEAVTGLPRQRRVAVLERRRPRHLGHGGHRDPAVRRRRSPPTMRWCLVPRTDYRVDDTWVTCALRGTGSNTLVLDDVFIPEHRAVDPMLLMTGRAPGAEVNPSPVFRLSFSTALGWYLSSTALGSATRTVRDFVEYSKAKRSKFTGQSALNETMIVHIGTASAQLEAARSLMHHRTRLFDGLLGEGHVPALEDALASSRDATTAVRLCVDVVERCMRFSGGSALFEQHTVQQGWRDVHGVAAHMGYNTDTIYGNWGRQLLGLPLPPGFV